MWRKKGLIFVFSDFYGCFTIGGVSYLHKWGIIEDNFDFIPLTKGHFVHFYHPLN